MAVLLKIRVESRVAENFKQAAKLHGKTPYAYLLQVVKQAATARDSRSLKNQRRYNAGMELNRMSYDLVSKLRDDDGE